MDEMQKLLAEIAQGLNDLHQKVAALQKLAGAQPSPAPAPASSLADWDPADDLKGPAEEAPPQEETPAPAPEPAPAPPKPDLPPGPLADFVESLHGIEGAFSAAGLPVDPKDIGFVAKVGQVLAGFSEEERQGDKGSKVLYDCLKFLDKLHSNYHLPPYAEVTSQIFKVLVKLLSHLEADREFEIFPRPLEEITSAVRSRVKAYDKAVKEHKTYNTKPEGTIVGVLQHGALLHGRPLGSAQILVSRGEDHPLARLGRKSLYALIHDAPRHGDALFKAAAEVRKLLLRFGDGQDEEAVTARYLLNTIHEHNESGAFKKLEKEYLEYMRKLGYIEIIATVGKTFDESYSPGKYERRKVRSSEPEGQIVAILRRGFLDRNGVSVQKALVAVSGG